MKMFSKKIIVKKFFVMLAVICLYGGGLSCSNSANYENIPFRDALDQANVNLSSMLNGQSESLMLGNGDLYGIVWQKEGGLFMRVTKNDIWDARVNTSKDGPLPKVDVSTGKITGSTGTSPSYKLPYPHPRCAAAIRFETPENTRGISGKLDLLHAVATIDRAESSNIRILADRNVVLINTTDRISLEVIKAETIPVAETGKTGDIAWLYQKLPGDDNGDWGGMEYALALAANGNLKVVSLVSSYDIEDGNVLDNAINLAQKTIRRQESKLVKIHERVWEQFWTRSGVELADKDLQNWWYRMLYFANTVCKPGAAPVALMPPLATDATPWHADYHFNYNAWQAFWPLPAANHSELADPWISYVNDMLPRFKWLAMETYDIDGVFFPISSFLHEPDPAVCKSNNNRQVSLNPWGMTIGMIGMTIQSMWQKHLCKPDREYMETKIYPTLREGAKFYVTFMERCKKDADGKILLGPSYSPEHGSMGIANCPFDIAYVHYTFDAFIQAAGELKVDQELAEKCRKYKSLLGEYPTAMDKNGKPVVVDWKGCKYKEVARHNIEVPSTPVFPGDQVTWFSTETQKDLFRHTIRDITHTGNNSHIMINIARARLSMPEAISHFKAWVLPRELPNGFIQYPWAHGTFMQEMIGLSGVVNEFLLQSVENKIRVFPCWPKEMDAKFNGLRAQGGFLLTAEQKNGKVTKLEIKSTVGGKLQLLKPWETIKVNGKTLTPDQQGIVTLKTRPGQSLVFEE